MYLAMDVSSDRELNKLAKATLLIMVLFPFERIGRSKLTYSLKL